MIGTEHLRKYEIWAQPTMTVEYQVSKLVSYLPKVSIESWLCSRVTTGQIIQWQLQDDGKVQSDEDLSGYDYLDLQYNILTYEDFLILALANVPIGV